jgi:hypothetical protein
MRRNSAEDAAVVIEPATAAGVVLLGSWVALVVSVHAADRDLVRSAPKL